MSQQAVTPAGATPERSASASIDPVALARLYGEPLFALPRDLYIPPDALRILLEAFEGPLDLLLYLIRKQNFNILDIPMAALTRQYLSYVDDICACNLELAGEYLLMAATLIEIKSRLLLPPKKSLATTEQVEDPRVELVRRLLEYEQLKRAAQRLAECPQLGRDFLRAQAPDLPAPAPRWPAVCGADLQSAWRDICARARLVQHHSISREPLSVREHMSRLLRRLRDRRCVEFGELFDPVQGTAVLVVTFIAMLELAKETLIELTQAEAFAPIYVRLACRPQ
ncbi:ScpA family protein [Hydrogenophaga sp.]|uniref:segregation and condensation protein A n=1 Tax=Hydrogenophaga sp. TaxID=1904254 RepID=UPI0019C28DD7|nr:ScpA family protein [Hydrogenophaga sp.]MBD3893383.1 segregation/condensation protein A [Hydrogenophaga sp.]